MGSLYEIDERLRILEEYGIDSETGELLTEEEFYTLYDEIQMDLFSKIDGTICFAKNLLADAEAIKAEEQRLAKRRKIKENLAERLQNRIDNYIHAQFTDENGVLNEKELNAYKLESPRMRISYRKSDSVQVTDITKIPKQYIKTKVTEEPIKADIKKAIKNGEIVDGATVITNYNMQIV